MSSGTDWRNETAADVGFGNWEAEEARGARVVDVGAPCYQHHMVPDGRGGGRCACGETVSADEL